MKNFTIAFFIVLCCVQGFSQTYVSTTGNDATGTGTQALPYKTIVKGVQAAPSGGTVLVLSGNYPSTGPIYVNKPLTIQKSGANPVLIDASSSTDIYVLGIVNTSNVTIDGLTITNKIVNGAKGIWILANSGATANLNNITVKNCSVKNIGWISNNLSAIPGNSGIVANAIRVDGGNSTYAVTNVKIHNNEVSNCATGWGEAVSLAGNVDGFSVSGNKVYNIANIGIDAIGNYSYTGLTSNNQSRNGIISLNEVYNCMSAIANSAGIYLDGAVNCKIERNKVYNSGIGIAVGAEQNTATGNGGPVTGNIVNNNLCYNNVVTGAIFGGINGSGYNSTISNTKIFNNTFYKNRTGAVINGVTTLGGVPVGTFADIYGGEVHLQNINGVTFKNNILYASTGKKALLASYGYTVANFVSNYNLFYRDGGTDFIIDLTGVSFNGSTTTGSYNLAQFSTATNQDANSVVGNPGFINAPALDFRLAAAAFAANKGDVNYDAAASGTADLQGNSRLVNGRVDIGCYELQSTASVQTPYSGIIQLPGTIEAENFDNGGEGIAYHDNEPGNTFGIFRAEGVDIENCSEGGYNLAYSNDGEWTEYIVNVATSGSYNLVTRVASPIGGTFHIELDGANITGTLTAPNTGGWQTWVNVTKTVTLPAGQHVMRFYIDTKEFNTNKFVVTPVTVTTGNYFTIKNRWKGTYLYDAGINVGYGATVANNNYKWEKEVSATGYFFIKNLGTGEYMHVENQTGSVQCAPKNGGWWSAQWSQESINGTSFVRFRNRWQTNEVIHIENQTGFAQYANPLDGWWSAQWELLPVAANAAVVVNTQQATEKKSTQSIRIFPNPAPAGNFFISIDGLETAEVFTIMIYNQYGKLITERKVQDSSKINYNLPVGFYTVQLISKNNTVSKKLVVQ
jgi:parallel beta-helix repeat protein